MSGQFYVPTSLPLRKEPRYPVNMRVGGRHRRYGHFGEQKEACQCRISNPESFRLSLNIQQLRHLRTNLTTVNAASEAQTTARSCIESGCSSTGLLNRSAPLIMGLYGDIQIQINISHYLLQQSRPTLTSDTLRTNSTNSYIIQNTITWHKDIMFISHTGMVWTPVLYQEVRMGHHALIK